MENKEINQLIAFHQAGLDQYRQYMSPSSQYLEEQTIKALGELGQPKGVFKAPGRGKPFKARSTDLERHSPTRLALNFVDECTAENPCCDRRGEYNGFGSGHIRFTCPKDCPCHD